MGSPALSPVHCIKDVTFGVQLFCLDSVLKAASLQVSEHLYIPELHD